LCYQLFGTELHRSNRWDTYWCKNQAWSTNSLQK
jgi:hypothetical protein